MKANTQNKIFVFIFLVLGLTTQQGKTETSLPAIRKEIVYKDRYENIKIFGDVSITLTNDPAGTVIIEGNEKTVKRIKHTLENNTLTIDANKKQLFAKITIYLSALTLEHMQVNGNAYISSSVAIRSDVLHISLNGEIDVKIRTMGKLSFDTPEDFELIWR